MAFYCAGDSEEIGVTRPAYSPRAILDPERLQDFVAGNDPSAATAAAQAIDTVVILALRHQRESGYD